MRLEPISKWGEQAEYLSCQMRARSESRDSTRSTARGERGNGGFTSANANVSVANVKRSGVCSKVIGLRSQFRHLSGCAPEILTIRSHLTISSLMYLPNSSGDIVIATAPCFVHSALTSRRFTILVISPLWRFTLAEGVPFVATSSSQI